MNPPIHLRLLDPARDGEALHAIFGDEASCTYLTGPAHTTVAETTASLLEWSKGCEETCWAICETPDGDALGRIAMIPRERNIWEAACMVAPAARGRNLAARALAIVIDEVFATREARRVFADIDPENLPSIRVFEKLGFQYEGRLRSCWRTHIGDRDSLIYSLIDSDPRPW